MENVPIPAILMAGIFAVVVIIVLSPVESINKPLDDTEKAYYARVTHCITVLQVCVLIILFCLGQWDYFYAGYISIILVAVFMVIGKIAVEKFAWQILMEVMMEYWLLIVFRDEKSYLVQRNLKDRDIDIILLYAAYEELL